MSDVVIANPVINSPFEQPVRYFEFGDRGITGKVIEGRRRESSYFVPIPQGRRQTAQLSLEAEWTKDRLRANDTVNRIRDRVAAWRKGRYHGVTQTTLSLLNYWNAPDRDRKLFFCQLEAVETAIYISEVAGKVGDGWIENELHQAAVLGNNPELFHIELLLKAGLAMHSHHPRMPGDLEFSGTLKPGRLQTRGRVGIE